MTDERLQCNSRVDITAGDPRHATVTRPQGARGCNGLFTQPFSEFQCYPVKRKLVKVMRKSVLFSEYRSQTGFCLFLSIHTADLRKLASGKVEAKYFGKQVALAHPNPNWHVCRTVQSAPISEAFWGFRPGHRAQGTGHRAQGTGHRAPSTPGYSPKEQSSTQANIQTQTQTNTVAQKSFLSGASFLNVCKILFCEYSQNRDSLACRLAPL